MRTLMSDYFPPQITVSEYVNLHRPKLMRTLMSDGGLSELPHPIILDVLTGAEVHDKSSAVENSWMLGEPFGLDFGITSWIPERRRQLRREKQARTAARGFANKVVRQFWFCITAPFWGFWWCGSALLRRAWRGVRRCAGRGRRCCEPCRRAKRKFCSPVSILYNKCKFGPYAKCRASKPVSFCCRKCCRSRRKTQPHWEINPYANYCGTIVPPQLSTAMLIYTSGSTGRPKGVLVNHHSYVSYTLDFCNYMNFLRNFDTVGQMASLSFDASLEEVWGCFCAALPLVILTDEQIRSGADLQTLVKEERITAISTVPSLLSTLSADPAADFPYPLLRFVTLGGDAIIPKLVKPWTKGGKRTVINSYGPTEAAIVVTRYVVHADCGEDVPIGAPTCGTVCAIVAAGEGENGTETDILVGGKSTVGNSLEASGPPRKGGNNGGAAGGTFVDPADSATLSPMEGKEREELEVQQTNNNTASALKEAAPPENVDRGPRELADSRGSKHSRISSRLVGEDERVIDGESPDHATTFGAAGQFSSLLGAGNAAATAVPARRGGVSAPQTPVPHGELGELCVAGNQVASGYLNRGALTADKFVDISTDGILRRYYRTGDLCKIASDTKLIHYYGRIDDQIKIRGNRIELGAVESALAKWVAAMPGVEGVVEDPVAAKVGEVLVGYVCFGDHDPRGGDASLFSPEQTADARSFLADLLPPAAVPSYLMRIKELPRQTASGKIDRKKLPSPFDSSVVGNLLLENAFEEDLDHPFSSKREKETALLEASTAAAEIRQTCTEVLGLAPPMPWGAHFMRDCGADSIKIASLVTQLRARDTLFAQNQTHRLFHRSPTVVDVLSFPTIAEIYLNLSAEANTTAGDNKDDVSTAEGSHASTTSAQQQGGLGSVKSSAQGDNVDGAARTDKLTAKESDEKLHLSKKSARLFHRRKFDASVPPRHSRLHENGHYYYYGDFVMHPILFSLLQFLFLAFNIGIQLTTFVIFVVLMLDIWYVLDVTLLQDTGAKEISDSYALSLILVSPVIAALFFIADFLLTLLLILPLYRVLFCNFPVQIFFGLGFTGVQPGVRYRKWGLVHLYLWWRKRIEAHILKTMVLGRSIGGSDEIISIALRFLGAKIGRNVVYGEMIKFQRVFASFLAVGEDVVIGPECVLACLEHGQHYLTVAPIDIGVGVRLGARSYVGPGSVIPRGCRVENLAAVPSFFNANNTECGDYELLDGVPAVSKGVKVLYEMEEFFPRPTLVDDGSAVGIVESAAIIPEKTPGTDRPNTNPEVDAKTSKIFGPLARLSRRLQRRPGSPAAVVPVVGKKQSAQDESTGAVAPSVDVVPGQHSAAASAATEQTFARKQPFASRADTPFLQRRLHLLTQMAIEASVIFFFLVLLDTLVICSFWVLWPWTSSNNFFAYFDKYVNTGSDQEVYEALQESVKRHFGSTAADSQRTPRSWVDIIFGRLFPVAIYVTSIFTVIAYVVTVFLAWAFLNKTFGLLGRSDGAARCWDMTTESCWNGGSGVNKIEPGVYSRKSLYASIVRMKVKLFDFFQRHTFGFNSKPFLMRLAGCQFEALPEERGEEEERGGAGSSSEDSEAGKDGGALLDGGTRDGDPDGRPGEGTNKSGTKKKRFPKCCSCRMKRYSCCKKKNPRSSAMRRPRDGSGCNELATCFGLLPDLTVIGPNSFWADSCRCTMLEFSGENLIVKRARFPQNFFMGNSAMIEPGDHPSNYLVGVNTVAHAARFRRSMHSRLDPSRTIFGNPAREISSMRVARFEKNGGGGLMLGSSLEAPPALEGTHGAAGFADEKLKNGATPDQNTNKPSATVFGRAFGGSSGSSPSPGPPGSPTNFANGGNTPQKLDHQSATDKFAYEPSFAAFLFRGFLFDIAAVWVKIFPSGLLITILVFWLVNDFEPVYQSVAYAKQLSGQREGIFGWRSEAENKYLRAPPSRRNRKAIARSCAGPVGTRPSTADCAHRKVFFCKRIVFRCSVLSGHSGT